MKYIFILFFCLNLLLPPVFGLNIENLQELKNIMPEGAVYTKVPRGLIISIDGNIFFDKCESVLKESSLYILDEFAGILKQIPNYCVIENHLRNDVCSESFGNWELSAMRSSNIAEYLLKYNNVPAERIFDIGFGDSMPFVENVSPEGKNLDNRIDLVLIEYEAIR